ncbi:hypothetical protein [Luteitalea sp.]|uniref:hypothetical protein n=1 Tax=Luteitalea sp. TaxID=2004800 RepID=UPI0025C625E6|nr:hypothetical protein [Luteitalea sp.]
MHAWLLPWARWLEHSDLGTAIRTSLWLYPAAEVGHLLGLGVLVGTAVAFDLRLIGAARGLPVDGLARLLLPCARLGFGLLVVTGLLLFSANATTLLSGVFAAKLGAITLGVVNASLFHRGLFPSVAEWNIGMPSPVPVRLTAIISLASWTTALVCGRLLAYL